MNELKTIVTITAKLYKQSGEVVDVTPENGTDFSLQELQGYVGGYIETLALSHNRFMVINEEGKFAKGAERNEKATEIAVESGAIWFEDFIAGNALVCTASMVK